MDGEAVIVPKEENITLSDVNQKLLKKISVWIDNIDTSEDLERVTNSVSKLNSSFKNNEQFGIPETEAEKSERKSREIIASMLRRD